MAHKTNSVGEKRQNRNRIKETRQGKSGLSQIAQESETEE